jgi:type IV pilus assembly protein PilY1
MASPKQDRKFGCSPSFNISEGFVMNQPQSPYTRRPARQRLEIWVVVSMLMAQAAPAWPAPVQMPLFNRADLRPKPNVMLLLDDSGSMTYQYLPERDFTLNSQTVHFPNDAKLFLHPDEISSRIFSAIVGDTHFVSATLVEAEFDATVTKINQMQMRSPQVNSIYYNPAKLYQPWLKPDGTAFPNAKASAANLDPMALDPTDASARKAANTSTVDLTAAAVSRNAQWYCGVKAGSINNVYSQCGKSQKSYNPGLVYLLADQANPNDTSKYALFDINNSAGNTYPKQYKDRTDCKPQTNSTWCSQTAERQNFANWFVYYRSRLHIAQGAIPAAFMNLTDNLRVGWGTIHSGTYTVDGVSSDIVQQGVRDLTTDHKNKMTKWMRSLTTLGGTPTLGAMISVGAYFQRQDDRSPWATDMDNGTPRSDQLTCRRAYNILVTDGYYRGSVNTVGNADKDSGAPFADVNSNTLADIAMSFYATDLWQDLAAGTKVAPVPTRPSDDPDPVLNSIKSDNVTTRHLNQFMIGLGVTGALVVDDPDPAVAQQKNDATLKRLASCGDKTVSNALCWPPKPPDPNVNVNEIDDLWHAAINSRGAYFSVKNKDDLQNAFNSSLQVSIGTNLKEAGVATALPELVQGNLKFIPQYTPINWTGDILAYTMDADGKVVGNAIWQASTVRPTPDARNIVVWDGATKQAFDFTGAQLTNPTHTRSATLIGTSMSSNLIDYLRGANNAAWTTFRKRDTAATLPDFINSTPLYVGKGTDLGYGKLPTTQGGTLYATYLTDKSARKDGALFVGGNGGMMHTFNATTGVEAFGFVPEASLPNIASIARLDYGSAANYHRYLVDGPLIEADAYFKSDSTQTAWWHDIVVGTMGAGGKAVYALTLPSTDATALSANSVLWEATSNDMGYITSEPQVGVLPDGSWKVFVGNGLDSVNGHAALLMIDVGSGAITPLTVGGKEAPIGNGMGGVALVRNNLGQVVGAYAGDNLGNVWRFDVQTSAGTSSVVIGNSGSAIFSATDSVQAKAQPIVSAPIVTAHPKGGNVVVINTGRLSYTSDATNKQVQSVYGIWDTQDMATGVTTAADAASSPASAASAASSTTTTTATVVPRSALVNQSVTDVFSVLQKDGSSKTFYSSSTNEVKWNSTGSGQVLGWYLDLDFPDLASTAVRHFPKAVYAPIAYASLVLVSAIEQASATETCSTTPGQGYSLLIDALTGVHSQKVLIDTNGDGVFDSRDDARASGFGYGGGKQGIIGDGITKGSAQSASGRTNFSVPTPPATPAPMEMVDRVWRQLLNPPHP